jgi:hypothetical protein
MQDKASFNRYISSLSGMRTILKTKKGLLLYDKIFVFNFTL